MLCGLLRLKGRQIGGGGGVDEASVMGIQKRKKIIFVFCFGNIEVGEWWWCASHSYSPKNSLRI